MPRYVAFLRAINVGGHTVTMSRLRALFEELELGRVETFIASGNVVFESRAAAPALERKLAAHLERSLGYAVATFLRTDDEVAAVAAHRAFPSAEIAKARAFVVGFLATPLTAAERRIVAGLAGEVDAFHVNGREIYWKCRVGQGESKFSNAVLERALRRPATWRGMNTVRRLAAKYPPGKAGSPRAARRGA